MHHTSNTLASVISTVLLLVAAVAAVFYEVSRNRLSRRAAARLVIALGIIAVAAWAILLLGGGIR